MLSKLNLKNLSHYLGFLGFLILFILFAIPCGVETHEYNFYSLFLRLTKMNYFLLADLSILLFL